MRLRSGYTCPLRTDLEPADTAGDGGRGRAWGRTRRERLTQGRPAKNHSMKHLASGFLTQLRSSSLAAPVFGDVMKEIVSEARLANSLSININYAFNVV